ncbi:DUF6599 family protein [Edaphobacter dinghuensis]|uniref:Uncharacterized protein n=1 Tax=Edaphobacter dinghuensis TaxID=1560005 RepID=A0A917H6Q2_9BACT|nr:DUF6599 family protein [Edaphobacter dinghuensis]GGG69286.1 hypothetical protein GCM10011585_09140 [Edaphobacter dinghuensis]
MVDRIEFKLRRTAQRVVLLCLVGAMPAAFGQSTKTMLVEPPTPLLPAQFGAWQPDGSSPSCSDCPPVEGVTGAVLKEDGVSRISHAAYHRLNKPGTITLDAYQFGDATGAASAFTFLRKPESRMVQSKDSQVGAEMAASGADYIFRSGTTVVVVDASKAGAPAVGDLRLLESTLPKIGGPRAQPPLLPTLLPTKGLDVESERYALGPIGYQAMGGVLPGDIVGFDKSAEVVMAKYKGRGLLTLLLYPTPQIAGNYGREIVAEMNRQGAAAGTVKLRREGPLVAMTTGAWSAEEAQKAVEGVHLNAVLTVEKTPPPEFRTEVRKTVSLLTSIALLSGLLALAAIILGLVLGFGRAAIRVLQGKPAATEPEFLRIDLSGRAEKIHLEGELPPTQG